MSKRKPLLICSLFLNYFVFAILLNSVGSVILQVQSSFSVSAPEASVLEAYKDLSIAIFSFFAASFISMVGYKRAMLLALMCVFTILLAMPQMPSFWMNKLLFMITGASFAVVKVSVFATLGLLTDDKRRHASLMSFLEAFFMVGVLSGYFIFSAFVGNAVPESLAWYDVYYLLAALALLATATLFFTELDEPTTGVEQKHTVWVGFVDMLDLAKKPLVLIFVLSIFLYVLVEQGIMSWLPTYNNSVLNLPASLSIQMASILAASIAVGRFLAGYLSRKIDWYPLLCICLLLSAVLVLGALPLADSVNDAIPVSSWGGAPLAAYVFPLIGLCLSPIYPIINSVVLSALPRYQHAHMTGLIVVFSALGGTVGSIITGSLFERFDGTAAFYFSLIPLSGMLATLLFLKRHTDRSSGIAVSSIDRDQAVKNG